MRTLLLGLRHLVVGGTGLLMAAYLLNPFGAVDLIPDALPFCGNLDDATAALILFNCLRYFGLDLTRFLRRTPKGASPLP